MYTILTLRRATDLAIRAWHHGSFLFQATQFSGGIYQKSYKVKPYRRAAHTVCVGLRCVVPPCRVLMCFVWYGLMCSAVPLFASRCDVFAFIG